MDVRSCTISACLFQEINTTQWMHEVTDFVMATNAHNDPTVVQQLACNTIIQYMKKSIAKYENEKMGLYIENDDNLVCALETTFEQIGHLFHETLPEKGLRVTPPPPFNIHIGLIFSAPPFNIHTPFNVHGRIAIHMGKEDWANFRPHALAFAMQSSNF